MAYRLPTFNLLCNIWNYPNMPPAPPAFSNVPCCLALGRRTNTGLAFDFETVEVGGQMWLLLPPGTDIRDTGNAGGESLVEVGAGTLRMYEVDWVDDAGGGFPNEHRIASISKWGAWPTPYPRPAVPFPPPVPGVVAYGAVGSGATSISLPCTRTGYSFMAILAWTSNGGSFSQGVSIDGTPLALKHSFGGITIGSEDTDTQVYYGTVANITTGVTASVVGGDCIFLVLIDLGTLTTLDNKVGGSFLGNGPGTIGLPGLVTSGENVFASLLMANPGSNVTWFGGPLSALIIPDLAAFSSIPTLWQFSLAQGAPLGPGPVNINYSLSGAPAIGGGKAMHSWG